MKYYSEDAVVMYDCDDTLVLWSQKTEENYTKADGKLMIVDPYDGKELWLTPHKRHIKLIHDHLERGKRVVIWSAGGAPWARAVAIAIGLEDKDVIVMCKPQAYIDDLNCSEFMGPKIYLGDYD